MASLLLFPLLWNAFPEVFLQMHLCGEPFNDHAVIVRYGLPWATQLSV